MPQTWGAFGSPAVILQLVHSGFPCLENRTGEIDKKPVFNPRYANGPRQETVTVEDSMGWRRKTSLEVVAGRAMSA